MHKKAIYGRYLTGVVVFLVLLWGIHQITFRWIIHKTIAHVESKWKVHVSLGDFATRGIAGAAFQKVMISYASGDTLFWANHSRLRLKMLPLIVGKVQLADLQIDSSIIQYLPYLVQRIDTAPAHLAHRGKGLPISYRLRSLFKRLPSACWIGTATVRYFDQNQWLTIHIDSLRVENKRLTGAAYLSDANSMNAYRFQGRFVPGSYLLTLSVQRNQSNDNPVPYLMQRWNLSLSFDRAYVDFQLPNASTILFSASATGLNVLHPKLAEQPVKFDSTGFSLLIKTDKYYWEIDSASQIVFNGFTFPIFVRYNYDTLNPQLAFAIPPIKFSAQQFFDALPKGAFRCIVGLKADGNLSFVLRGRIPFGQLDSLYLFSQLQPYNFHIRQYGLAYLPLLNDTFTLCRHEPGLPPAVIHVDSTASSYTHLRDISKYLINAVLTSEDGSFFYHKGFNEEAFAKSLAENIRKKRFARGASTISMQLIRNVFLSRNKTLSRKFEEILLTWILENTRIVSKERMLEVYFNIIEWGPNIYGVKQAAQFYFNKKPSQLTLQESIFLAAIIPSPKYFRYTFVNNGTMKDGFEGYFRRVAQIMLARNQIQPQDTVALTHRVRLTGEAKKFLISPQDSLIRNPSDTIFLDPNEDF